MTAGPTHAKNLVIGRYRLYDEIASGGMAAVHLGRLLGDVGFSRTVAIKRLHPNHAKDPDIVTQFTDEARIAARIRHPNVVPTLDVISQNGEVFLVMEYVHGEVLSRLIVATSKRKEKIPPRIVASILSSALHGLHAAHEAKDTLGRSLGVVHRDISPQNIIVGVDGVARVLDFGIARAAGRLAMTVDGAVKGKLAYMSPEHLQGREIDRRTDIYASGVVLWEALTCKRLHAANANSLLARRSATGDLEPPSARVPGLPKLFDDIALRALRSRPEERFPTALAMAEELESSGSLATTTELAAWVQELAHDTLEERARLIERIENDERRSLAESTPEVPAAAFAIPLSDEATTEQITTKAAEPPRVESTIKMSSSNLVAVQLPQPLDQTDLERTREMPNRAKTSGTYAAPMIPQPIAPAPPASRPSAPSAVPPTSMPLSAAPLDVAPREAQNRPAKPPHRASTPLGVWIAVAIAAFFLSGAIVALLIRR